jgi:hypothetical protein
MAVKFGSRKPSENDRRKALERWVTRIGKCEVTLQAIWPIVKSLIKRDGSRAPTAIHGPPVSLKYQPLEKATAIAVCLEYQFTPHDLCDENHNNRWRLESKHSLKLQTTLPLEN